jgi:hypothetical protein
LPATLNPKKYKLVRVAEIDILINMAVYTLLGIYTGYILEEYKNAITILKKLVNIISHITYTIKSSFKSQWDWGWR